MELLERLEEWGPHEFEDEEEPRCPHCGKSNPYMEGDKHMVDQNTYTDTCNWCVNPFQVNVFVQMKFDTSDQS